MRNDAWLIRRKMVGVGMSVTDELVQAAAEAVCFGVCPEGAHEDGENLCGEAATVALQAAFAKLPECEAARRLLVQAINDLDGWYEKDAAVNEQADAALAALAREFGGRT